MRRDWGVCPNSGLDLDLKSNPRAEGYLLMAPTLQGIKDYLHTVLAPHVTDDNAFNLWLDELCQATNTFGQILALNLYIDLTTGAITESGVANVLNKMVYDGDARSSFYQCIEDENNQSSCVCQHSSGQQQLAGDRYVRVMTYSSMAGYCCKSLTNNNTPEAQAEMEQMFYAEDPDERCPLGMLSAWWRGRMENVWVTSKAELDEILGLDIDPKKKASLVRTRLGFYGYDTGRLVFVAYPAAAHYEAFQPTSLDANPGCLFFVSKQMQPTDTWGETCSLSSGLEGLKERVHRPFQGLTDDFETEIIGEVEAQPPDMDHLLTVAWSRVP
jgi:hypothetical protein